MHTIFLTKCIGISFIILSTSLISIVYTKNQKEKINICDDLICFCDEVIVELTYSLKPIVDIVNSSSNKYVSVSSITSNSIIDTKLSSEENKKISNFLYSLGKTDAKSQKKIINSFKLYLESLRDKYKENYNSKSKIYISIGVYSGVIISLILI